MEGTEEVPWWSEKLSEGALLVEPREFFDKAVVGVTATPGDHWNRRGGETVAIYDELICIQAIMEWLGCGEDEAYDWYCYNTTGAWMGEGTPTFIRNEES